MECFKHIHRQKNQRWGDKSRALANPFYSWHVTCFTDDGQKTICFLNDATGLFITLPNVTRLSCYNLQTLFEKQLASQLAEMGIRQRRVDHYLQQGGQWQINEAISHEQVIRLTRNVDAMKKMQGELSPELAMQVIRQSVSYDADKTRNYFKKLPAWQEPKKHDNIIPIDPIQLYNIFRQICYISKYREKTLASAG